MFVSGMMGEGQGEASASADSQGAAGGFADAQTPSRGEGESVWMSGRLGGVDEGSGSGRPPAHQLPHALSVYSGRDMVGVDDQITSPGDEGVPHLVPEALDDEQLQEMRRWLEGVLEAGGGDTPTSADTQGTTAPLTPMQTHGRDEGKSGWPSGRPASVDEGSQPGPPPTQQPTYLRLAHSGRRLVTGESQASPSGDEGVAQRSGQEEEEAEEGEIREMLAWLRGTL
ncbi:hypothetical protein TGARI_368980 [Toxoplasma gondii ARI]|uniref:Uncharacterized protein n=1 Tax=Toxoplasma gondii ARI TaxID=1074872 RepID=A0A139Y445_TOXGO|nr:hypothetical protein TGARI_368980 [Toxoplasma gondii ARI]